MTELYYDYNTSPGSAYRDESFVQILRTEHDELKATAQRYHTLCQNLIRGGVDENTLDLLSRHGSDPNNDESASIAAQKGILRSSNNSPVKYRGTLPRRTNSSESTTYTSDGDDDTDDSTSDTYNEHSQQCNDPQRVTSQDASQQPSPSSHQYHRVATRTVRFSNLAFGTTHADVAAAIRGGQLVDIYLNNRDNTASVSFALEQDARHFYCYAQEHGIYINAALVTSEWSERQFMLPGLVIAKLCGGASRNIVIRNCARSVAASAVTRDLGHIHNLFVLRSDFVGNDLYINTNSIVAASFARTCLMSQFKYKASRIEWAPDECAQSLDRMPRRVQLQPSHKVQLQAAKRTTCGNRFTLLDFDN